MRNCSSSRRKPIGDVPTRAAAHDLDYVFGYLNFVWQPRTLGGPSPAMVAGATDRLWSVADLVEGC